MIIYDSLLKSWSSHHRKERCSNVTYQYFALYSCDVIFLYLSTMSTNVSKNLTLLDVGKNKVLNYLAIVASKFRLSALSCRFYEVTSFSSKIFHVSLSFKDVNISSIQNITFQMDDSDVLLS